MGEIKWYVVRVVSGQEKKVKVYLENEIVKQNMSAFISQVIIPTEKVYEVRNGKKKVRERNFFPGYLILSADLSNGEALHLVNNVPGVLGFLGAGDKKSSKVPIALRQSEINRILGKVEDQDLAEDQLEKPYMIGETVKVMDGPFYGFSGTVEEVFEEKKKLNVMVKIFGRSTPVELNYTQVERID